MGTVQARDSVVPAFVVEALRLCVVMFVAGVGYLVGAGVGAAPGARGARARPPRRPGR